jgi:hypothetical protein
VISRRASLMVFLLFLSLSSQALAQAVVPSVRPAPLVRLTGVLETVTEPRASAFPVLSVWIGDQPRVFRVARVESVIPAYHGQEDLREVSLLGLRFVADNTLLAILQAPEMHNRPIVVEGWLRSRAGILRVRSVQVVENPNSIPSAR